VDFHEIWEMVPSWRRGRLQADLNNDCEMVVCVVFWEEV